MTIARNKYNYLWSVLTIPFKKILQGTKGFYFNLQFHAASKGFNVTHLGVTVEEE